ncbi:hypothetical protein TU70_31070 [Bacillus mycoides]|nr:hypothetical protein TU70_31070 [Bacillus mycoides]
MNKLPNSMKNVMKKIKNIKIPNLFPDSSLASIGNGAERNALGELFSVAKSETKGTGEGSDISLAFKREEFASIYGSRFKQTPA